MEPIDEELMTFSEWMRSENVSPSTIKKYDGAITGALSEWAQENGLIDSAINPLMSKMEFEILTQKIYKLGIFIERNSRGHHMYSCALKKYAEYIEAVNASDIDEDIEYILNDQTKGATEKNTLVKARIGQGKYRKDVISIWSSCAVTGYPDVDLLIASHIKPWRNSNDYERVDPYNGLLLLPNLDRIFDAGLISFQETGNILISPKLVNPNMLGVNQDMRVDLIHKHQYYMSFHRKNIFLSNK